ncbi:MAG: hypothetical protein JWM36_4321 [Hyphomicrobiales bacterium]|nr:hypothetical protein [Hyphomicrobiales bacterium]
MLTCAGCARPPGRAQLDRQLPPPPAFAKSVEVQEPRVGEYLLVIAARERAGRQLANARIDAFSGWYLDLQKRLGGAAATEAVSK